MDDDDQGTPPSAPCPLYIVDATTRQRVQEQPIPLERRTDLYEWLLEHEELRREIATLVLERSTLLLLEPPSPERDRRLEELRVLLERPEVREVEMIMEALSKRGQWRYDAITNGMIPFDRKKRGD